MQWLDNILEGVEECERIARQIRAELPKNFIPKDKYNQVVDEKRQLIEQANAEKDTAVKNAVLNYALTALSERDDIVDSSVVKMLIDGEKITIGDDGALSGLSEQLESIKNDKPYLFTTAKVEGRTPVAGVGAPMGITKEQFDKMGYRDRLALYNDNPELYKFLTE